LIASRRVGKATTDGFTDFEPHDQTRHEIYPGEWPNAKLTFAVHAMQ